MVIETGLFFLICLTRCPLFRASYGRGIEGKMPRNIVGGTRYRESGLVQTAISGRLASNIQHGFQLVRRLLQENPPV